jgi:hypothetical protein
VGRWCAGAVAGGDAASRQRLCASIWSRIVDPTASDFPVVHLDPVSSNSQFLIYRGTLIVRQVRRLPRLDTWIETATDGAVAWLIACRRVENGDGGSPSRGDGDTDKPSRRKPNAVFDNYPNSIPSKNSVEHLKSIFDVEHIIRFAKYAIKLVNFDLSLQRLPQLNIRKCRTIPRKN